MKRIVALAGSLLALAGCALPTAPSGDHDAAKARQARALLEAASTAGALPGRSLN
jgi:hypothetical protein